MFAFAGNKKRASMLSHVKIFVSFAVIVMAANIALSTAMYVNYERHSVKLVQSYTVEELSQISYSTNFMFESAKMTLLQLYSNPAALKLMNYADLGELETASLLRQVGIVNINMPFINSVYIYNKRAQRMYYDGMAFPLGSFPDKDIVAKLQTSGQIRNLRPVPRHIPAPDSFAGPKYDPERTNDVYTFVFYDSNTDEIDNAIILNVSQEWMETTIRAMDPGTGSETVIADADGLIALGNDRYAYLDNLNSYADFGDMLNRRDDSGYLEQTIDGRSYLISYVSSPILNWKYIRFTPYDVVSGKLQRLLLVTLLIFLLVTVVAVLAVLFISRAVYGLFRRNISEIERKYEAEKNAGYDKKQQYLRMLATRRMEESALRKRFAQYGIRFDLSRGFLTVLLKIDRYALYCDRYSLEDRALLSYGLINIIGELAGPRFTHEAVDLGDGVFAILFNLDPNDDAESALVMEGLIQDIRDKAAHYLHLSLSAALGELLDEIAEVPDSVAECREALAYKLFGGPGAMLYVSVVRELNKMDYTFPEKRVAELFDHLLAGDGDAVRIICGELIEGTRGHSIASLQTAVLRLAIAAQEFLRKYGILAEDNSYERFIDIANRAASFETLDEIAAALQERFDAIAAAISRSQENVKKYERYSDMMDKVHAFLEREFANERLDPELIAEHLGITAKYLRTLYKKTSGESLGESINRYRMERAKSLLEHPDMSVQEAAARSGFTNINYFYTLFKKYNGLTPNEFRSLKSR
ncbi:helix-turn-helix domain-containing protein [Paenibacillus cymbidii]|uniref:helix-turn-helix domain-containing protein n=1 Tax=Paenibacillus cymbidii TaxID=1639034 RepID=UPI001436B480|nr:helix-turn-helix domain-containing protein [Paenibacillus cymbidii]